MAVHSRMINTLPQRRSDMASGSVEQLQDFLAAFPRTMVITGAGISNDSGIPTYRDHEGTWKSNIPIQHGEFMRSHGTRQRYWARSFSGWPTIANALPNGAHHSLTKLEEHGLISLLVTQNVDRLHQKAQHRRVIDLHGRLDQVVCMDCNHIHTRAWIQGWLHENNPHLEESSHSVRPDGDADVADELIASVKVPVCQKCNGVIKPNVVFYGASVAKKVVSEIEQRLKFVDSLLIVGSSLMVYSSFRFCKYAVQHKIPIACINEGLTRADDLFKIKVAADCTNVLGQLEKRLKA
ncbi:MAG: NAD-dependent SIR2 family protein deacetylase [Pseudohongiellaceae bacterium]|jgi:NAD-dependent SIR2 family protein deacetylase